MKTTLKKYLLAIAVSCLLAAPLQAQPKIAIIDLKKVFDGYYKTKQADTTLKERAADFDKTRKGMLDDYQSLNEKYKKELEGANDQAVSADEREKRKKSAESTLLEIKKIEQDVSKFDQTARVQLGEQQRRMRDRVLGEIREVIDAKAKTSGYSLVIDTAAESINSTPVVLFSNNENDITDDVLKQINSTMPADGGKAADKKDEKK
ncbi:MAG: OmpH family outer membrane protein [Verrucomicrobia bacterium]|nr:OmpH family outer membrane protein [Verrucomicrobiota bacterium]